MLYRLSLMSFISIISALCIHPASGQPQRTALITESLFSPGSELLRQQRNYGYGSQTNRFGFNVWRRNLVFLGVSTPTTDRGYNCGYETALQILVEIRNTKGIEHAYQKEWAMNQQIVLSACEFGRVEYSESLNPYQTDPPPRAEGDFIYQSASLNFYRSNYELALAAYQQLAADSTSPMRPRATYMVMRTLKALRRTVEAYAMADSILADQSLTEIHEISHNYRFVIAYRNPGEVAEEHLHWLLQTVRTNPERSANPVRAINDSLDASYQLNLYFPAADRQSGAIDWWLDDTPPSTPKMRAVYDLSRSDELVDWLQAEWAKNVLRSDWLWSLHELGSYWTQNANIVQHALERWNAGDGLHWLQIVASRVHPQSPSSQQVLNSYNEILEFAELHNESADYKLIVIDLWLQTIRIHLGRAEYQLAMDRALVFPLGEEYSNIRALRPRLLTSDPINRAVGQATDEAALTLLRWLVYVGEHQHARRFLDMLTTNTTGRRARRIGNMTHQYRILLARDWSEVMANFKPTSGGRSSTTNYESAIINLLPSVELIKLAEHEDNFTAEQRGTLTRTAFTRAVILQEEDNIITFGIEAAIHNPELRDEILAIVNSRDFDRLPDLLLKYPRFRITSNLVMAWSYYRNQNLFAHEIDIWNHNDNNWWCRYDHEYFLNGMYRALTISPSPVRLFQNTRGRMTTDTMLKYQSIQEQFLSTHPVLSVINTEEERLLANAGSGPEYLSLQIIARDKGLRWRVWEKNRRERQALALHLAVKSTRYGCNRSGPHSEYSKKAFTILHKDYANSPWTQRTPYWFN
ncbi:MAG: hypothetical protein COC19_02900 [SAR86 cluster bacterium]|uniref:Tetratricopeptide repeat protein n=1 Tax=SAR86 cluster bacterium TaxID=2030880 RepID=A0A2A4MR49_9GAMM|nr:MAG: hypothetical protein COC19_02900 [SAR86 cluster bacterium]